MIRNKKIITLFFILIVLLALLPISCNAVIKEFKYIPIDQKVDFEVGPVNFIKTSFANFSDSSGFFGMTFLVNNNTNIEQSVTTNIKFYNEYYNVIATLNANHSIPANKKNYKYDNIDKNSKIISGYTANDIKYYSLTIGTNDVTNKKTHINNSFKHDYTIEKYNIDMVVNENNTFDITETITTNFNVSKHGIFRKIPLKNEVKRLDGTISKNKVQITNIDVVGDDYKTYNEDGYKVIKIGDANKTLTGQHTYTIRYTYNIGKDPLKNKDELYFNLIGEEWDVPINNITFNIKMLKEFDKSLLGFSTGKVGSTYNSNIEHNVYGDSIIGRVDGTVYPGEALTVRLELPEGYFVRTGHKIDSVAFFTIILCAIFVLMAYRIWSKYGKDEQEIETVEFYPPEGYNSAEIGYLYHGTSKSESVISLLIYLANKGYLKIEETEEDETLDEDEKVIKIIKLKEYDGDNDNEREFFNGLFAMSGSILEKAENIQDQEESKGNEITWEEAKKRAKEDTRTYVTTLELEGNLYTTVDNIEENIEKEYEDKIIDKTTKGKRKWLVLMIIAIILLITINPMVKYSGGDDLIGEEAIAMIPFAIIFPGVGFSLLFSIVFGKTPVIAKIFAIIWGLGFGGGPLMFFVLPCLLEETIYFIAYIIGLICIAILIMFFQKTKPKRTEFGKQIIGKLSGFKRFLETAEKEQLERLVMKEPEYFYNILPYTYALGVSDKWISRFESIAMNQPNWYNSNGGFDFNTFSKSMETISSISTSSSSSSSSGGSSGGSSSGGGSSGGGSGGGGGGSW